MLVIVFYTNTPVFDGFASDQSESACGARVQDTGLGCGTPPRAP